MDRTPSSRSATGNDHYLKQELEALVRTDPQIFDFLQQAALDGLWYWDLENPEIEWMNEGFWRLFGIDPATREHLAAEWQDLIEPDDLHTAVENFERHCADPSHPYDQLVRYRHRDGSTVWVRCRGLAIRDANGKPIRMLGAHTDMTALMRTQKELQELNLDLEARIQERTAELEAARHAAETANQAKSSFLANMSHELRTPLNVIIGYADLLSRGAGRSMPPDRLEEFARNIARSGQSLLMLINDVLDFAKLEANSYTLANEAFSLIEEVTATVSSFQMRADDNNVSLTVETGNLERIVHGDCTRLRQVLNNLIDNAIKFTRGGAVTVRAIGSAAEDASLLRLTVDVIDTGPGIERSHQERIFNPFSQSDASITRRFGGTGLGLPISRQIARLLGGDVTVWSAPGAGSTFTATFVFENLTDGEVGAPSGPTGVTDDLAIDLGLTVLAVDDVESNLEVAEAMLVPMGCDLHKARNGQEAVDWMSSPANRDQVDVILMDLHMPLLDGINAAREIQKMTVGTNAPAILAWTADVTIQNRLSRCGVEWAGTVLKPVTREAMVTSLRQARVTGTR